MGTEQAGAEMMPRSLRETLYLTALLLLLAACFPVQRHETLGYDNQLKVWRGVELRQITLFWQPIATLNTYSLRTDNLPERAALDWETCTLGLVVTVSLGMIYFCWLDGRLSPKGKNQAEK
jgi:hypothetical protein